MKIILIRHGETRDNKAGIIQGQTHGELNEEGVIQAKKVSERLRNEKIDVIFSSDLKRAHDTAKIISKHHDEIPFLIDTDLRERCHGEYEGKRGDDLDWTIKVKGQESKEELINRAKRFIDKIYSEYKNKKVMLVSHGGLGRALISVITKKEYSDIESLHNTSISIFEIYEDKSHKIHLINCKKHLSDLQQLF